ncbi:unnamed protein product, partial [Iphiclides podalirius]
MAVYRNLVKLSRNCSNWTFKEYRPSSLSTQFCMDYNDFYPRLIDKTLERIKYLDHLVVEDCLNRVSKYYKRFPLEGEFLVYAYEMLESPKVINDETLHLVYSVACAVEMTQTYFYLQDDVYDKSLTRSGKKCWHLLRDASRLAMNDCSILRSLSNEVLKQTVEEPMYGPIMDVFNECYLSTEIGQHIDLTAAITKGYDHFTMKNYRKMAYYKASFFSMIYPIWTALVLSNKGNEKTYQLVTDMCHDLGMLVQIHNDFTEYLDYDESMSKKSKTDIQIGKFTWNAVVAIENFNTEDRKIFEQCYGSPDPEKIEQGKPALPSFR